MVSRVHVLSLDDGVIHFSCRAALLCVESFQSIYNLTLQLSTCSIIALVSGALVVISIVSARVLKESPS